MILNLIVEIYLDYPVYVQEYLLEAHKDKVKKKRVVAFYFRRMRETHDPVLNSFLRVRGNEWNCEVD